MSSDLTPKQQAKESGFWRVRYETCDMTLPAQQTRAPGMGPARAAAARQKPDFGYAPPPFGVSGFLAFLAMVLSKLSGGRGQPNR